MENKMGKWWENYIVRYVSGMIFAIFVLFYLSINYGDKIGDKIFKTTYAKSTKTYQENKNNASSLLFGFIFQSSKEMSNKDANYTTSHEQLREVNTSKNYTVEITEVNGYSLIMLAVVGSLYMYIASIPIYLAHIFRFLLIGVLFNNNEDLKSKDMYDMYKLSTQTRDNIILHDKNKSSKNNVFETWRTTSEYIKTYKDMREHGNAFGIMIMEIICIL